MKTNFFIAFLFLLVGCTKDDIDSDPVLLSEFNLTGEWHITAIHDSPPQGPTSVPLEDEVISIIFDGTDKFTGTTSVNTFGGTYSTVVDTLTFPQFLTTEVLDTPYGLIFYEALEESESVFALSFEDNKLNLAYAGFKFLVLEKQ